MTLKIFHDKPEKKSAKCFKDSSDDQGGDLASTLWSC